MKLDFESLKKLRAFFVFSFYMFSIQQLAILSWISLWVYVIGYLFLFETNFNNPLKGEIIIIKVLIMVPETVLRFVFCFFFLMLLFSFLITHLIYLHPILYWKYISLFQAINIYVYRFKFTCKRNNNIFFNFAPMLLENRLRLLK